MAFCMARRNELQLHHQVWPEIRKVIKGINPEAYILAEHMTDCIEFLNGFEWDASMNYFGFGRPVRQFLWETDEFVKRLARYNFQSKRIGAEELAKMFIQHLSRLPHQLAVIQYNMFDSYDIPRLYNNPDISFESYRAAVIITTFSLIASSSCDSPFVFLSFLMFSFSIISASLYLMAKFYNQKSRCHKQRILTLAYLQALCQIN